MDCVRTAIRQNAKSVKCLYRRDKENMPGSAREVANAEEEGVEFVWLTAPKEFIGKNKIESLKVNKIKLGEPDETGRRKPEIQKDSEFEIKSDMAIKALGFDPEDLPTLFGNKELQVSRWGTIKTDFAFCLIAVLTQSIAVSPPPMTTISLPSAFKVPLSNNSTLSPRPFLLEAVKYCMAGYIFFKLLPGISISLDL